MTERSQMVVRQWVEVSVGPHAARQKACEALVSVEPIRPSAAYSKTPRMATSSRTSALRCLGMMFHWLVIDLVLGSKCRSGALCPHEPFHQWSCPSLIWARYQAGWVEMAKLKIELCENCAHDLAAVKVEMTRAEGQSSLYADFARQTVRTDITTVPEI